MFLESDVDEGEVDSRDLLSSPLLLTQAMVSTIIPETLTDSDCEFDNDKAVVKIKFCSDENVCGNLVPINEPSPSLPTSPHRRNLMQVMIMDLRRF